MSLQFIKQTIRSLRQLYGTTKLVMTKYTVGVPDFTTATPANTVDMITVSGIVLPRNINAVFFPKSSPFVLDRTARQFIIEINKCSTEWVKEGVFITYLGERYNIKWADTLEGYYYYVVGSSAGEENANG